MKNFKQAINLKRIPKEVFRVIGRLEEAGYEAYIVGGAVRNLALGKDVPDYDIATSATPEEVRLLFKKTIPTGIKHGTVTVREGNMAFEVTTFRMEKGYSDHRRPDEVEFSQSLLDDLSRRDFTFNAMALSKSGKIVDPYGGLKDLRKRILRAVGDADERFAEDALRMLRAVRFAAELGCRIEENTLLAIKSHASELQHVSRERIRDEFNRCLLSSKPSMALQYLWETRLLKEFIPELLEGVDLEQNVHHAYTVWEHSIYSPDNIKPELHLRLAALFHDIAKPRTLSVDENGERHFFHHEVLGARMTEEIMQRLKYDNKTIGKVSHLIRQHLALHLYRDMSDAAVRRLINRIGLANIPDLLELRKADRLASGTKKTPLSKGTKILLERIERVLAEDAAFGLKDLAVNGNDIMQATGIRPGPLVGEILNALLEEVLDDPRLNERDILLQRAQTIYER